MAETHTIFYNIFFVFDTCLHGIHSAGPVEVRTLFPTKSVSSKSIQWSSGNDHMTGNCQDTDLNPILCCEVTGDYNPYLPVLWVKDGVYISNGPPPGGFKLDISRVSFVVSTGGL